MTAHSDAVARRLAALTAELDAVRAAEGLRGAESWADDDHTRVRARPAASADVAAARPAPGEVPPARAVPGPGPDLGPDAGPVRVPVPGRHAARRAGSPSLGRGRLGDLAGLAGRVQVGPGPLAVLAVLVAVGVAVTAWWLLRADGKEVAPLEVAADPAPVLASLSTAPPSPSAEETGELVVDVAGKVKRPGIVVLRPGDRVVDALRAAGGARRGVALTSLNLARPVVDGEQIVVGVDPPPGVAASAASAPGAATAPALVNLNTAGEVELESLPQVGPVTARAIVAWRDEHGGFTSVEELLEVDGIGEATLAQVAPFVTL